MKMDGAPSVLTVEPRWPDLAKALEGLSGELLIELGDDGKELLNALMEEDAVLLDYESRLRASMERCTAARQARLRIVAEYRRLLKDEVVFE